MTAADNLIHYQNCYNIFKMRNLQLSKVKNHDDLKKRYIILEKNIEQQIKSLYKEW